MTDQPFEGPPAPEPMPDETGDTADTVDIGALKVEALKNEKNALQDRLLRTAAEFDNYRKRVDRERREQAELAAASLLEEMLPIVDDLERALQAPATGDAAAYRAGVELILRQMMTLLTRRGVTPIETDGADFDPRIHQAVSHEPSEAHREGQVIEELRRGYRLGDRLLRPAMVKVAQS
jgi:molecular chaperone GrpE